MGNRLPPSAAGLGVRFLLRLIAGAAIALVASPPASGADPNAEALWQTLPAAPATPAAATQAGPRRVAVMVNNRAGREHNDRVQPLEDKVIALLAGAEFAPISRDDTVKALQSFPTDTAGLADRNALGTRADRLLADQTTAVRLAQNLGAQFLLLVNLTNLKATPKRLSAAGIQGFLLNYNLGVNYRICDGGTGAALDGGNFSVPKSVRSTEAQPEVDPQVFEDLLDEAATRITEKLRDSAKAVVATPVPAEIEILVAASPRDLQGQELSLPDLRVDENNRLVKADAILPVFVAATVEIDGMATGTAPVRLRVAPGLHKVRLSRAGFEPVELTVNARDRLTLNPAMQLDAAGFARWQEVRAFLAGLDAAREMTAAEAERLRGVAQMLRQSGFRIEHKVDAKSDINVNTKEALTIVNKRSIFSMDD